MSRSCPSAAMFVLASCTGMLHEIGGQKDLSTSATFNMFTNSDYDLPTADWEVVSTDDNFLYHECLTERTDQVTGEVTESGIWETCESPYDLRDAPGIDVEEGFNGQLTVRAVSRSGAAGESITKPFRRAVWAGGFRSPVFDLATFGDSVFVGGSFTQILDAGSWAPQRIVKLFEDGSVDLSVRNFLRGFDGDIYQIVVQSDGKILVGGQFTSYDGDAAAPDRLIRLNVDGTVDSSFSGITTGFGGSVYAVALQADGKILVGGEFTAYNGNAAEPDRFIRLNSDGSVDSTFTGLTTGFGGTVSVITVQADGKILVGGGFASYNGNVSEPDMLIRLNANGTVDGTFSGITTGFNQVPFAIVVQPDGKILVGGNFTSYNGSAGAPDRLIRLNANGSVDGTFSGLTTGFDNIVYSLALDAFGKIYAGGRFTSYNGNSGVPDRLIRLNSDGSIDTSFSGLTTGFDDDVQAITLLDDGKIFIGGDFTSYNGSYSVQDKFTRLNNDGTLDPSLTGTKSGFMSGVRVITPLADGTYWVGGDFLSYNANFTAPFYFSSLTLDGAQNANFTAITSGFDAQITAVATQSDGKLLVGGNFTSYNGNPAVPDRLLRLNSDGTVDDAFNGAVMGFNDQVESIVVQPDGKILVGGLFTSFNGSASAPDHLVRLNSDGSLDTSFTGNSTGFSGAVYALVLQPDSKIIVGGDFTSYNGNASVSDYLVRLNSDGTVDSSFTGITTGFNAVVYSLSRQTDGKILVGGDFTSYNGNGSVPDRVMRLDSDGSVDATFSGATTGADGWVDAFAVQSDGKILITGGFTGINGNSSAPDYLARLNSDGSFDSSFSGNISGPSNVGSALLIQSDGKILLGGSFTSYNGDPFAPDGLLRLNSDGSLDETFGNRR